jgi:hypothetical protein
MKPFLRKTREMTPLGLRITCCLTKIVLPVSDLGAAQWLSTRSPYLHIIPKVYTFQSYLMDMVT